MRALGAITNPCWVLFSERSDAMMRNGITTSSQGKAFTISVHGRFDYLLSREFREAYKHVTQQGTHFIVDLSEAEQMDSSAFGTLLLVKEHAASCQGTVTLRNLSHKVADEFQRAGFHALFDIE